MQTAANDMSHVKRFIDTLRSRFGKRQLITGSEFVRLVHVVNHCGHLGNT
jgi:hypothetical protein